MVEEYGNDGKGFVCNNCFDGFYWSSSSRSCEQCPEEMTESGCIDCSSDAICNTCNEDTILNPLRTGCQEPI